MCDTCGCGQPENEVTYSKPGENDETSHEHQYYHSHHHRHDGNEHAHKHQHHPHDSGVRRISIEEDILKKNDLLAERNRGYFEAKNIHAFNFVSSPGSGKTLLLEKTITELKSVIDFYVIEGDQQTMNDAARISKTGAKALQINTGNGCHLDSEMINIAVKKLDPKPESMLMIENVGNLVCPSLFDLGEKKRIIIISVTEGEDKPLKYPTMFQFSDLCIINKTDLLPYVDFDIEKVKEYALRINDHLKFFEISAKTGEGMDLWYNWLKSQLD